MNNYIKKSMLLNRKDVHQTNAWLKISNFNKNYHLNVSQSQRDTFFMI